MCWSPGWGSSNNNTPTIHLQSGTRLPPHACRWGISGGDVTIRMTDRQTVQEWTNSIGQWSVARMDGPSPGWTVRRPDGWSVTRMDGPSPGWMVRRPDGRSITRMDGPLPGWTVRCPDGRSVMSIKTTPWITCRRLSLKG